MLIGLSDYNLRVNIILSCSVLYCSDTLKGLLLVDESMWALIYFLSTHNSDDNDEANDDVVTTGKDND